MVLSVDPLQTLAEAFDDSVAEDQRRCGQDERKASTRLTRLREEFAVEIKLPQHNERQDAGRDAAAGKPDHRGPVDTPRPAVRHAATGLGGSGVEEIGADRGRRVDAEQQDQQRRHQ